MSGASGLLRRREPGQDVGLLDGHRRTGVRDRFRFNPLTGNFIPWLATNGNVAHEESVRHDDPQGRQVQRRNDADAEGREVQLGPSKDGNPPPERAVGVHRAPERSYCREHGRLHVRGQARIPAIRLLSLQHRDRSAARLQQVLERRTSRPATWTRTRSSGAADKYQSGASSTSSDVRLAAVGTTGGRRSSSGSSPRRGTSWTSTTRRTRPHSPTSRRGTSTSSTTSPRSRRSRESFKTFYSKAPYHLGANTTWLFPNTTKKPLNDPQFRRALAFSINMNQILDKAYQGLADKASPTGSSPSGTSGSTRRPSRSFGFSYNLTRAKAILAAAGYKDSDRDGYVENKDGSDYLAHDRVPERMVGLDDGDPGHRGEREGRRDQGHAWLPGLRNAGRRPRSCYGTTS